MKREIEQAITSVVQELFGLKLKVELKRPDEQFGDYATNIALQIAKQVGQNPRQVAEDIKAKFSHDLVTDISIAGPGFINLKLSDLALLNLAKQQPAKTLTGKTAVAEYSDPNAFKVLHAGHLYTTLAGDAIASLLEHAGAKVHRVNFGGDVGLHVARAMWAIIKDLKGENPEQLNKVPEDNRAEWVSARYVEGNTAYEENEDAKAEIISINKRVYELHNNQDKESPFAQIYWSCRQWSYDGFDKLYKKLQVDPFEKYYPESLTTPGGIVLAKQALEQGVLGESDGAIVFKGEDHGLHTRVFINSEGLPTYETKDLGLAAAKWDDYHPDINVIITGNDIIEYMKVVLKVASHFYPEITEQTKHLTHGMIKLSGGVKMSSRKGNFLRADDILEAAEDAAKQINPKADYNTVLAAVKYAFLKNRIGGDIIYDSKESVALEGNSGPYLQYSHARARSIIAKVASKPNAEPTNFLDGERSLVRKLGEYSEVIDKAVEELMPHHICTYLYELAQTFNNFYEHNRVIDDDRQATRLYLVGQYADTLKKGLGLLNITAPERM